MICYHQKDQQRSKRQVNVLGETKNIICDYFLVEWLDLLASTGNRSNVRFEDLTEDIWFLNICSIINFPCAIEEDNYKNQESIQR